MLIRCPNCGADNRDGAKFCKICGLPLPTAAPGPPPPTPGQGALPPPVQAVQPVPPPGNLTPAQPGPITPGPSAPGPLIPMTPTPKREFRDWLTGAEFLTSGIVQSVEDKSAKPPREPAHIFFTVAGVAIVLPALLGLCLAAFVGGAVLMALLGLLGLGGLTICLPYLLGLSGLLTSLLRRDESRTAPKLELRVAEAGAQRGVNITMWGQREGGPIKEWDEVEVWGKWDKGNSGSARAWRIRVISSADPFGRRQSGDATIRAKSPFPWWLALAAVALALGMILLVYWPFLSSLLSNSAGLWGR